ncbi:hypothetical protein KUTeg_014579 [Tegillarca granosa]|uniref:Uncharacterized protein n=1 Tax=Tegillarca granosa TaxID=220873 RepID=A0ABQ9ERL8_TEGGR|nr:hypothetical protein KUTeg_014579 [Tegillarca granosa]
MDFGNFNVEVDFQDILDFDEDFNELIAVSSLPDHADFLHTLKTTEYDGLPPPETPTAPENQPKKRFRFMSDETIKQFEEMNQSEQTKKNTKWGLKILQVINTAEVGEYFLDNHNRYHCPVLDLLKFPKSCTTSQVRKVWYYQRDDLRRYKDILSSHNWLNDFDENIELMIDNITQTILHTASETILNKTVTFRHKDPLGLPP